MNISVPVELVIRYDEALAGIKAAKTKDECEVAWHQLDLAAYAISQTALANWSQTVRG